MPIKVNRARTEKSSLVGLTAAPATPAWIAELKSAYSDPLDLLRDLGIARTATTVDPEAATRFHFRVPRAFAERMQRGNPRDPLLLQVLPRGAELTPAAGFSHDPVGDADAARSPGLLHKYHGRALLILTGGCAIQCRYCFRREYPYAEAVGRAPLTAALDLIARDPSIVEVILSGGDPLLHDDAVLGDLVTRLAALPHVRRVRIHSRLPIVIPTRVTPTLIAALTQTRLQTVVVVHANHPQEIDHAVIAACQALRAAGITVLNQAVLLREINDDVEILMALSEQLFAAGVLPYYVHLLDRVHGTAHFEVSDETARRLQAALRTRLPGYLMPRFVREVAGHPHKLPLHLNA